MIERALVIGAISIRGEAITRNGSDAASAWQTHAAGG